MDCGWPVSTSGEGSTTIGDRHQRVLLRRVEYFRACRESRGGAGCSAEYGLDMAEYGLDMLVPASADREQRDLVDVRFCEHDGSSMAHLLYEVEGQPVSYFLVLGARQAERSLEVMGLQARLWSNDAAACVLVGREDAAVMDKVVTYM